jgi:cephalosporin-C deacetylase-like acetyl esterase
MKLLRALVQRGVLVTAATLMLPPVSAGQEKAGEGLASVLRGLDTTVIPVNTTEGKQLSEMLSRSVLARLRAANRGSTEAWHHVRTRTDWEQLRDSRLRALRSSLGQFPKPPAELKVHVTRRLAGEDYVIENLVFESRPGLWVTANLYLPARPSDNLPGFLICHSHHNAKTEGELQDMGMTWARQGCAVLVMDQLGHGERRQHPFRSASDYPAPFRVGRQDYYFRFNLGMQLHLVGDSLIGWMVWDLMRGVDLLLARPGIAKDRIILLGSVAGGGDPAAVTAALDPRIAAVAPFNFGGPQPETHYPLPVDAESSFDYAGGGSWESTRNLRLSARDGFLPWVIVAAVAPRRLIYGHEFDWDREHDPVWARLSAIFAFYEAGDHLAAAHGRGMLSGKPPESTHCNNIGPEQRVGVYAALKRWFEIPIPMNESQQRHSSADLTCLTPQAAQEFKIESVHKVIADLGTERAEAARSRLMNFAPADRRPQLRQEWTRLLGDVSSSSDLKVTVQSTQQIEGVAFERISLTHEDGIIVPLALLVPQHNGNNRLPIVVAFCQEGKQELLRKRSDEIVRLLQGGVAVCLPDVRGTGETKPARDSRGRTSSGTSISSSELMLGQTLLGARLRDLRTVCGYLRSRPEFHAEPFALWGDSFAATNPYDQNLAAPLDADKLPEHSEPLGGLLALFGALFEDEVKATYVRGGLVSYGSLLQSPYCYFPQDCIVPGALTTGDLGDVAAALAPRPLRLSNLVDGLNRSVTREILNKSLEPAQAAYRSVNAEKTLVLDPTNTQSVAAWLISQLKAH